MVLQTLGDAIVASLQKVFDSVAAFVPLLVGAVVVFIIGWVIAVALGKVVEQIIKALRVDALLQKLEVEKTLEKAGWHLNSGAFIGGLVKWFLIVVFLLAAVNILGLEEVSNFLRDVLLYLPNVVVAALILIIAALVADVSEKVVRGSVEAAGHRGALVGVVTRYSIWVFAFAAALLQLGIAASLVQTLMTGFVGAVALGLGLAFGLGGKDAASEFIARVREELRK
jgi:hypothetical protein